MSQLIKRQGDGFALVEDRFTLVADDEPIPEGDVIISLARYLAEGEGLNTNSRQVGVRIEPHESVEDLAYDLAGVPVVALNFAKFRDGRPYSAARLLRERLGFVGELRAVGDVLREQALFLDRCGFDSLVPADGSTAQAWADAVARYRHVYQRGADARATAADERAVAIAGANHGL